MALHAARSWAAGGGERDPEVDLVDMAGNTTKPSLCSVFFVSKLRANIIFTGI